MYLKHFALPFYPFGNDIPPDEMYASGGRVELATRLRHLLEMSGIGLISGDCGSGKSSACRVWAAGLHTGLYKVFYVPLSTGNPMDLYKSIAWEMGLPIERNRAALYRQIKNEVTRLGTEARTRPVLILDEAQGLRSDVLEEMRRDRRARRRRDHGGDVITTTLSTTTRRAVAATNKKAIDADGVLPSLRETEAP